MVHRCLHCSQVYVALCRLSQNSDPAARDAVRKGIDIMIPNLAKAAASEGASASAAAAAAATQPAAGAHALTEPGADLTISKDSATPGHTVAVPGNIGSSPSYARYLKRVLTEDGHVSVTLVHLLQVIVRNRDMFFQSR